MNMSSGVIHHLPNKFRYVITNRILPRNALVALNRAHSSRTSNILLASLLLIGVSPSLVPNSQYDEYPKGITPKSGCI